MEKNVKTCLKRRGYTVFKNEASDEYQFVIPFKDGEKRGKVFRCTKDKIGLEDLANIFRPYIDQDFHIIVIYKGITAPANNSFKEHISKYLPDSELIEDTYFQQDVMSHPLVPEYEKLEFAEKMAVIEDYKTEPHLFPQMLTSDPVAILLNFRNGDMVQVKCFYNFTKRCIDKEMPPAISYCVITNKCD